MGYVVGNVFGSVCNLLFMPFAMSINEALGAGTVIGFFASQIAAILGNYAFPITMPRRENRKNDENHTVGTGVIYLQIAIGIMAILILLGYKITEKKLYIFGMLCGFVVGYSPVLQWQWYNLTRKCGNWQVGVLLISRVFVAILEFSMMSIGDRDLSSNVLVFFVASFCMASPIFPTLISVIGNNVKRTDSLKELIDEIKEGYSLFRSSLQSMLYVQGPSIIVSVMNPNGLYYIQQFDRVRGSISNMSGVVLNSIYPYLIKKSIKDVRDGYKLIDRFFIGPLLILLALILIAAYYIQYNPISIFEKLGLDGRQLLLALGCGLAAMGSNLITMSYLHIMSVDKLYGRIIRNGALFFLVSGVFIVAIFDFTVTNIMLASFFAEVFIFYNLKRTARVLSL